MSPFERKFGRYAIRNLSFILVICYAVGYVLQMLDRSNTLILYLTLDPYAILHGQVWRLFTWILIPPSTGNIFLTLIMLYFYCSIGTTLERTWGTYRYNVYLFSGMLFTIAGSFLQMGFHYLFHADEIAIVGADNTIAVHIRHIREKIEANPREPRYLKAVWGNGYKVG